MEGNEEESDMLEQEEQEVCLCYVVISWSFDREVCLECWMVLVLDSWCLDDWVVVTSSHFCLWHLIRNYRCFEDFDLLYRILHSS